MALIPLLPPEGTYEALKAIRRAKETISFTGEEIEFYEIETIDGQIHWSTAKANEEVKDIPIESYIMGVFRNKLSEINRNGKLVESQISIYDKFVVIYE